MAEVRRVDWVGIFLLVSGLSMFLLGVSWGMPLMLPPIYIRADKFRWPTQSLDLSQDHFFSRCWWLSFDRPRVLG